jgi:uncharacterized DUF497 family protein
MKGSGVASTLFTGVIDPLFRKTKKGHYVAFGPTGAARYLVVTFEKKPKGTVRPITGWDMNRSEVQYYKKHRR